MEKINIALPSDENYSCGLIATACSIAQYASREFLLSFHVLDGGITDSTFEKIGSLVLSVNPNCEFHRHRVSEAKFDKLPSWSGNRMAYARLMIPDFLAGETFCIYCDTDYIWFADISQLWKSLDKKYAFQSTAETWGSTLDQEQKWFEKKGLEFVRSGYICTGLLVFNIPLIEQQGIIQQMCEFLHANPDSRMADQTAINAVLPGKIGLLDSRWQTLTISRCPQDEIAGKALHYAGEIPWKVGLWINMLTDTKMAWHRFMAQLYGVSVFTFLRRYFTTWQIIYKRGLFWLLCYVPGAKSVMRAFLCVIRRKNYWQYMEPWLKPVKCK